MSTPIIADEQLVADTRQRADFRPDIQALRGIAVLVMLLYHLFPASVTGGYVGVDMFFVISGFLITSHLNREVTDTGRIRLGQFYGRRARRLLPVAFTALLVSLLVTWLFLPYSRWAANAWEVLAAAGYGENWMLAAKAVDYSAASNAATMAQHYWSLSVEEQFYLLWPLLLLGLTGLRRRSGVRGVAVLGIALLGAASLSVCVYSTEVDRSAAYFITPARMWEFAIGAGLALVAHRIMLPALVANLGSMIGFALIFSTVMTFDQFTPFPGLWALAPTIGTALVIAAGTQRRRLWHEVFTCRRPVQWLGDISYSLYVWHWPLIVLAPFVLSGKVPGGSLLVLSLLLGGLSKRYLENRATNCRRLTVSSRRTLVATVAGMAVIGLTSGGLVWGAELRAEQAEVQGRDAAVRPCYGAAAFIPGSGCADPLRAAGDVNMNDASKYYALPKDCRADYSGLPAGSTMRPITCDFSSGDRAAPRVWLIGDSHARQWQAALVVLARERHWILRIDHQNGCPFAEVRDQTTTDDNVQIPEQQLQSCMRFGHEATEQIAKEKPAYVFTASFARREKVDDGSGRPELEQYREGFQHYWHRWTEVGAQVFPIADPPLGRIRPESCVLQQPKEPLACAMDRVAAIPADPLAMAARADTDPNIRLIDLTNYFCDATRCYSVIGTVPVYFDDVGHLNAVYSRTLGPMLAKAAGL